MSWWEPERWRGVVWTPTGEVRGAVQVHAGRAGHWLRILGANALTPREVRGLLEQGLRLLEPARRSWRGESLPIYATVRDYEAGLSPALTSFGFAPYSDRARFVRHTLSTSLKRMASVLAARDKATEVPVH